jgi:hypothetical protein
MEMRVKKKDKTQSNTKEICCSPPFGGMGGKKRFIRKYLLEWNELK